MKKINYFLLSALALGSAVVFSCDDEKSLPQIDGYNNSDEVAADNLKAHWTFDGTNEEDISGLSPLTGAAGNFGTVGFEEGQIGQALKLTSGALRYPNLPDLNTADALANYTVSMWVKIDNNRGTAREGFTMLFGLFPDGLTQSTTGDFMWGNINMAAETAWFPPSTNPDTLVLKGQFIIKKTNNDISSHDNRPDPKGTTPVGVFKHTGEWVHFVTRWNATTSMFDVIGNGQSIGAYSDRDPNNNNAPGSLRMNVPCSPVFGNGATKALGFLNNPDQQSWSPMATASIDDVRIFNTALSDAEINALYNLGVAGR